MYSVIDIESNGAGFRKENIIEIAIYKYDGHEIVDQFITLVNPESEITPFVQRLTNISQKMVKSAPRFHEIAKRIVEITQNTTLVGHNIEFDYRMLRQEFKRLGYEFKINTIDTIPLAKKLIPEAESYSLGKLVKSLGIPLIDQHRASGDARATLELFKLLMFKDKDSEIIQQHHEEINAKTYLNKIKYLTQDLPFERGIIYFQNAEGKIIFFDFVDDLSKFAKTLFNSKSKRHKQIQDEVEHIHYDLTGSDILAKLIITTKGLQKRDNFQFGLYYKNEKYYAERISNLKEEKPLLRFKSFTQGLKAVSFIETQSQFKDVEELKKVIHLNDRNELWLSAGRTLGEKSFLIFQKGKLTAFGFYELYSQLNSWEKLSKLQIDLKSFPQDLQNDLQLALLRSDFEIIPLPEK
ncbi:DNA polymerase-3 subunit epsilon [Kaistella chaponensis]|jgi:DNA polymerase-3 subunit epsilon|uniref:DNA polymerase-3 subunit epsilon n=1 Tax=Kaistella chaponensis TaxID=713588 RepID=A0A1N7KYJ6_9FLAO|nr:3'-5' exonuclease [Kaistella chaponensis]SIS66712.1 DNA polymerase-3 subunit epsilon [Kaistella chaponensis]